MDDKEDRIRRRAYELWLLDGQPEGRETEHWFRAAEAIRMEDLDRSAAAVNPSFEVIGGYLSTSMHSKRPATASSRPPRSTPAGKGAKAAAGESGAGRPGREEAKAGTNSPRLATLHRSGSGHRSGKVSNRHH